jgi:hypothetical protein
MKPLSKNTPTGARELWPICAAEWRIRLIAGLRRPLEER